MTLQECYEAAGRKFPFSVQRPKSPVIEILAFGSRPSLWSWKFWHSAGVYTEAQDHGYTDFVLLLLPPTPTHIDPDTDYGTPPVVTPTPEPPCTCPTELLGADHPGCAWGEWRRAKG